MNAKKNFIRTLVVATIMLIVFCVLAFTIPFIRGTVFWLGFIFSMVAILAQLYVAKKAFANGEGAKSKFYGFPIARVGTIYLVVQIVAGLICMALAAVLPVWIAVVVFVLILAVAVIGFITVDTIRDEVERQDMMQKMNVTAMRDLQSRIISIAAQCDAPAVKSELNNLAEKFRFSDPVSSDATSEAEAELSAMMDELQTAVVDGDASSVSQLTTKIAAALNERNRLCKLNK